MPDADRGADPRESVHLSQLLAKQLERLSEKEQNVVRLAYYEGYTQQEIADMLREPLGTVKSRARAALLKLRPMLAGAGGELG